MENIGKMIRTARIGLKLRQKDVAAALGVERTTVSNWERGCSEPDVHMFFDLINVLHLKVFDHQEENTVFQEQSGRKLRLKLSDSSAIDVITPENACVCTDISINLQVNGKDSHGNSVVFRVNADFLLENDTE